MVSMSVLVSLLASIAKEAYALYSKIQDSNEMDNAFLFYLDGLNKRMSDWGLQEDLIAGHSTQFALHMLAVELESAKGQLAKIDHEHKQGFVGNLKATLFGQGGAAGILDSLKEAEKRVYDGMIVDLHRDRRDILSTLRVLQHAPQGAQNVHEEYIRYIELAIEKMNKNHQEFFSQLFQKQEDQLAALLQRVDVGHEVQEQWYREWRAVIEHLVEKESGMQDLLKALVERIGFLEKIIEESTMKKEESSAIGKPAAFTLTYTSETNEVVVGYGAAQQLPESIQQALVDKVKGGANPTIKMLQEAIKDPAYPDFYKNGLSKAICESVNQKKRDPNIEKTLGWLEKHPDKFLNVAYTENGIVFSPADDPIQVNTEELKEKSRAQLGTMLSEKLTGYRFQLRRISAYQMHVICTQTKGGFNIAQKTLGDLEKRFVEYLGAYGLGKTTITVTNLQDADDATLSLEAKDPDVINQVAELLREVVSLSTFPMSTMPQSFFKWPDTAASNASTVVDCGIQ